MIIKEGTFTLYDGDDRKCRPHPYGPGQSFVDEGGGHVHIGRNEGTVTVKLLVTFIVPVGAAPRIDVLTPATAPSDLAVGKHPTGHERAPRPSWPVAPAARQPKRLVAKAGAREASTTGSGRN